MQAYGPEGPSADQCAEQMGLVCSSGRPFTYIDVRVVAEEAEEGRGQAEVRLWDRG